MLGSKQPDKWHEFDVFFHTYWVVMFCPKIFTVQMAALLHDIEKPRIKYYDPVDGIVRFKGHDKAGAELAKGWLRKMTFSNETVEEVMELIFYHMITIGSTNKSKMKCMRKFSSMSNFKHHRLLRIADILGKGSLCTAEGLRESARETWDCLTYEEEQPTKLAVNGHLIMKTFGLKPGPEVGRLLTLAQEIVYSIPSINTEKQLMAYLVGYSRA